MDAKQAGSLIRKVMGFVTQEDTLLPNLTVRETLTFAALMKLPNSMKHSEKHQMVRISNFIEFFFRFLMSLKNLVFHIVKIQKLEMNLIEDFLVEKREEFQLVCNY